MHKAKNLGVNFMPVILVQFSLHLIHSCQHNKTLFAQQLEIPMELNEFIDFTEDYNWVLDSL